MKQVTYDFNMFEIMFSLMRDREDLEDGYWEMTPRFELVGPAILPQMYAGQKEGSLPGVMARMFAISMTKVPTPGPLTIEIREGMVVIPHQGELFDDTNRNQNGSIESSQSSGEDSGEVGQDIS